LVLTEKEVNVKEVEVGKVADYFAKIGVVALELESGDIKVGDRLHFKGHTTDFYQDVDSMQIEHDSVEEAKAGDSVGIKVKDRARSHDTVYKVIEE
jgi:translation elongation factor EF-1alpha